jgi:predicted glycoside hydrolase/deacetylase ChbG (UPF0249 family)
MKLILHSDDFGLHPAINSAVIDAARSGVLTSTSWMANGSAAEQALKAAQSVPGLGIGVHLNIVRGRPLSHPEEIPSIVDKKGLFFNSAGVLLRKSLLGVLRDEDIYTEYRRQVQQMIGAGVVPTHFDGEKHTHLLIPACRRAMQRICNEFRVRKVRTIRERRLHALLSCAGVKSGSRVSQSLKLACLEYASRKALSGWRDIGTTELFFGVLFSGHLIPAQAGSVLRALLSLDLPGTVEWMFHLGYPADLNRDLSEEFGTYFLNGARTQEARFLMSAGTREEVTAHREKLISYRDL